MRPGDSILSAVGDTPLVRLDRLLDHDRIEVYGKLESLNPGGSIKDRPAVAILAAAIESGQVHQDTVVVESSSGNMGIGLAQACRVHGLRFICVVDSKTARQNIRLLELYGAQVDEVLEPDPLTGELLQARIARVQQHLADHDSSFWPNQYANENNASAHYRTTMREIAEALDGRVDYLFLATSTCGTLHGCGSYIRDQGLATRLVAVDALGSLIFSDVPAERSIPGLGAGLTPPLCAPELVHEVVHVDDFDCIDGCRSLLEREAILAGGSSGGVVAALRRLAPQIEDGARCALILCDRGERYLDTIFDDVWVQRLRESRSQHLQTALS